MDIVCYRRHGHNEADQPAFTQPLMYQRIGKQPSVTSTYTKQLLEEGVVDQVKHSETVNHCCFTFP